jgi:hypothetical protein
MIRPEDKHPTALPILEEVLESEPGIFIDR